MKKSGRLIALFGPDGSGKSTAANLLEAICRDHGLTTCRYHWRPQLLPSLKKANNVDFEVTRPNDLPTRPWVVSFGISIYFFLDFFGAYFVRFCPLLRQGAIIIYERYYYDLLFHPERYKLQPIKFLANLSTRIAPRPDLIVLLSGTPSAIIARKPELPLEEIKNQQNRMQRQLPKFSKVLNIDVTVTQPLDVAQQIYRELFQAEKDRDT